MEQNGYVLKRAVHADPLDEQTKALAGILEHERWARLEALVALQQGLRKEASHRPCLANINPNVYGLIEQLRHGGEMWMS
jgi:hypothetical protein